MGVVYLPIDNESVSAEWRAVLLRCRADGVHFNVNEGHRTFARQTYFWTHQPPLAARPSPNAPHIRTGRIDHAIDFNNASGVMQWLHRHGIPSARLTVPGESWHVEVDAGELRTAARKLGGPRIIKKGSKRGEDIKRLQVLLRQGGYLRPSWKAHDKYTLTVRRAVRKLQRKHGIKVDGIVGPATWAAAQHDAKS